MSRRCGASLLWLLGVVLSGSLWAAGGGVVVFGSYTNLDNARLAQARVAERFDIDDTAVVESLVKGVRYYRVTGSYLDADAGRELVRRARDAGVPGAWFLPTDARSANRPASPPKADTVRLAAAVAEVPGPATHSGAVPMARQNPPPPATAPVQPDAATGTPIGPSLQLRPGTRADGRPSLKVPHFDKVDIKLDGIVDEPVWSQVPAFDEMLVIDPDSLAKPRYRTDTRILYTDDGMYISAVMEQPRETQIARLSGRDAFINRDSWGLTLDTSGEGLYGYWFVVNLGGTVLDGKVAPERRFSNEWDGPWRSATAQQDDSWSFEAFLPWSMMTMPAASEQREMGFWINRRVAYIEERWSWPPLPFTGAQFMSALGSMELPGVQPKRQRVVAPFAASTYDVDQEEADHRIGMDVFFRPTSNLQIAATLNPDFGAVESDDVVVNLTAFETFFPEKRLFFQEGNEVFITTPRGRPRRGGPSSGGRRSPSFFNPTPTTLVNTRRIGGRPRDPQVPDDVDVPQHELNRFTDLYGAARLTGQQGSLRYGVLSAFEEDFRLRGVSDTGEPVRVKGPGRDFGIARLSWENTSAGRRAIGYLGTYVNQPTYEAYVHGIDTHWLSRDGKLRMDGQAVYSDVAQVEGYGGFGDIVYTPRNGVQHSLGVDWLDDKLEINDLGFFRRNDNRRLRYSLDLNRSSGMKHLRSRSTTIIINNEANSEWRLTRSGYFLRNEITLPNLLSLRSELAYFSPTWDDRNSEGNGSFRSHSRISGTLGFGTDQSKAVAVSGLISAQQEQIGGRWQHIGALGVTWKPIDRFSLDVDMQYSRRNGWLLHNSGREFTTYRTIQWQPKVAMDLFFSARQQLRFTLQWAGIDATGQARFEVPLGDGGLTAVPLGPNDSRRSFTISRMTTQLRYRWEIAPLSDLFLVYTRGSNIASMPGESLTNLFEDALTDTVIDVFVVKLRYRFGS